MPKGRVPIAMVGRAGCGLLSEDQRLEREGRRHEGRRSSIGARSPGPAHPHLSTSAANAASRGTHPGRRFAKPRSPKTENH